MTRQRTRNWRRGGWAAAICGVLTACDPGADLPPLPPVASAEYHLDAGDQVRVITFGDQTLSGQFTVDDGGQINLPLLGPMHAAGLTAPQLAAAIEGQLRDRKLLNDPSVSIESATRRPVFVLGEVAHPGRFPFEPGMNVLSAVATAGGFTFRAVKSRVEIIRHVGGKTLEGRARPDSEIQPGDVVNVLERHF